MNFINLKTRLYFNKPLLNYVGSERKFEKLLLDMKLRLKQGDDSVIRRHRQTTGDIVLSKSETKTITLCFVMVGILSRVLTVGRGKISNKGFRTIEEVYVRVTSQKWVSENPFGDVDRTGERQIHREKTDYETGCLRPTETDINEI